ncbi:MAG: aminotransferase class I/II-fold pyridoxal phosphate-dependent enzyme, partial [Methanobacterium paludis]|nr:aminotransferase class I/II-fold pyridoxal phosphate-dependent enzyme [Methanobacterium paludis]
MKTSKRVKSISLSGIRKMFELVGEDSINLGLGEPDFDTPHHIRNAAVEALKESFTHYTVNKGILELREAISNKLECENNVEADRESIIVTVGASEAVFM